MGMYTELIFGAALKEDTPKEVVESLQIMVDGDLEKAPKEIEAFKHVFRGGSYYFGINRGVREMWFDEIGNDWRISTRSNIKNYGSEIEQFLEWVKPYLDQGSGYREFYAIVTYEEAEEPTIYYLDKNND
jgi:hypothetical protein